MKKYSLAKKEQKFIETVWDFYKECGRHTLPWRQTTKPYRILVSELMLQQTQVDRVIPKYKAFISKWPTVEKLAAASLGEVLIAWQGLGYNRRAKFLHETARVVVRECAGEFPQTEKGLLELPGIGPYTARAILAFAYNQPVTLIETNVRQVYIHHFFADGTDIDDKELLPIIERTTSEDSARAWYAALMDYGTHLKKLHGNVTRKSKQYQKQSKFEGSDRQVRGAILRELSKGKTTAHKISKSTNLELDRITKQIALLGKEGLIVKERKTVSLP